MKQSFDVLVAGGGPAGSATALNLSRRGFSVALIEQGSYEAPRVGETLPPLTRQRLAELGVWDRFLACGPLQSYGIRTAWESSLPRHKDFIRHPYGCGWHVDRARFDTMLAGAAADAGTALFLSAHVKSCAMRGGQWRLDVARGREGVTYAGRVLADVARDREGVTFTGRVPADVARDREGVTFTGRVLADVARDREGVTFTGRVLVDATGRKALLASRLGSHADVADRLIAAVAFCERSEPARWALVEAVEEGWWYSAPLPDARMVFAYMTDSDLWNVDIWPELMELAPLTFERAGCRKIPAPSLVVSAGTLVRRPVAGANWIATGDAALAFDPLSGQGVLKSIETGTRCAAAIAGYFAGDPNAFRAYDSWVQETYLGYLSERRQFYGSVLRWPGSQFWQRRQSSQERSP